MKFSSYFLSKFIVKSFNFFHCSQELTNCTWLFYSGMSISPNVDAVHLTLISGWPSHSWEDSPLFSIGSFQRLILAFSLINFFISYFIFIRPPTHLGILAITLTFPFTYSVSVIALFKVSQISCSPIPSTN